MNLRSLIVILLLFALAKRGEAACLVLRLLKYENRYNTQQSNRGYGAACCEGEHTKHKPSTCRNYPNSRWMCDPTFRINLNTPEQNHQANIRRSGNSNKWSGLVEEDTDVIKFPLGGTFGFYNRRNEYYYCAPMYARKQEDVRLEIIAYDKDALSPDDFICTWHAVLHPMKYEKATTLCLHSAWVEPRVRYRVAMTCWSAPYVMMVEVQHLLEPGEETNPAYLPYGQGAFCSDRAPTFFMCTMLNQTERRIIYHHYLVPAGGPSWGGRRAVSGAAGPPAGPRAPAAAPPPFLALALALVLARR